MKIKIIISLFSTLLFYSSDLSAQKVKIVKEKEFADGIYSGEVVRNPDKRAKNKWLRQGKGSYIPYQDCVLFTASSTIDGVWNADTLVSATQKGGNSVFSGDYRNNSPYRGTYKGSLYYQSSFENEKRNREYDGTIIVISRGSIIQPVTGTMKWPDNREQHSLIFENCHIVSGSTLILPHNNDNRLSSSKFTGTFKSGFPEKGKIEYLYLYASEKIYSNNSSYAIPIAPFPHVRDGDYFEGTFKNGIPDTGILVHKTNSVTDTCYFKNGKATKGSLIIKVEGKEDYYTNITYISSYITFNGIFDENGKIMKGKTIAPDGRVLFEGEWVDGKISKGTSYKANGDIHYKGEYKDGWYSYGTMYYENGKEFTGTFNKEAEPLEGKYTFRDNYYSSKDFSTTWQEYYYNGDGGITFTGNYDRLTGSFDKPINCIIKTDYRHFYGKFEGELLGGAPYTGTLSLYHKDTKKVYAVYKLDKEELYANQLWKKYVIDKYGSKYGSNLADGYYSIGMTMKMCRELIGRYKVFSSSEYGGISYVTWALPSGTLLYFENSVLKRFVN